MIYHVSIISVHFFNIFLVSMRFNHRTGSTITKSTNTDVSFEFQRLFRPQSAEIGWKKSPKRMRRKSSRNESKNEKKRNNKKEKELGGARWIGGSDGGRRNKSQRHETKRKKMLPEKKSIKKQRNNRVESRWLSQHKNIPNQNWAKKKETTTQMMKLKSKWPIPIQKITIKWNAP